MLFVGIEAPLLGLFAGVRQYLKTVRRGRLLKTLLDQDAVQHARQARGHVDRTVHSSPERTEFAGGLVPSVKDVSFDDPFLHVAIHQLPWSESPVYFEVRAAHQQSIVPVFQVDVVRSHPDKFLATPFIDGLGGEPRHRLDHRLIRSVRRGESLPVLRADDRLGQSLDDPPPILGRPSRCNREDRYHREPNNQTHHRPPISSTGISNASEPSASSWRRYLRTR